MISLVVAYDRQGHIGFEGDMPWRGQLPADMARFKDLTIDHVVVMGRKTYESLPPKFRPLPKRQNWVLTRDRSFAAAGCVTIRDWRVVAERAERNDETFVIGGGEVYRLLLPVARRVYATRIDADFSGDTVFPELTEQDWDIAHNEPHPADEQNLFPYSFLTYERRRD